MISVTKPKFHLGTILCTPDAKASLEVAKQSPWEFIAKHSQGKWGAELSHEDRALNDQAIKDGSRLLSAYRLATGVKIWIISEAEDDNRNRASTTILLPENY